MSHTSLQTSMRALIILVAACAVASFVVIRVVRNSKLILPVGNGTLVVRFTVLDSESGEPLSDACITKIDLDFPERPNQKVFTNRWGRAAIIEDRLVNGRVDADGKESAVVVYPQWGFEVDRKGYEATRIFSVRDRIGIAGDVLNGGLNPSLIVVELKRQD
jgi:hypothetical protein